MNWQSFLDNRYDAKPLAVINSVTHHKLGTNTLFHEAAHILLHAQEKKSVYLDDPNKAGNDSPQEREANDWACKFLIPAKYNNTLAELKTKTAVQAFAYKKASKFCHNFEQNRRPIFTVKDSGHYSKMSSKNTSTLVGGKFSTPVNTISDIRPSFANARKLIISRCLSLQ